MPHRQRASLAVALGTLALSPRAGAEIDVRALARAMAHGGAARPASAGLFAQGQLSAIVEATDGDDAARAGLPRIGSRFSVVRAPIDDLAELSRAHPRWRLTWSAPLRPLMDRAARWTGAPAFRNETGLTGKGVFVGVIDTGVDVTHPDLRNADGSTRIAYLIDYSKSPAGLHPDAECQCGGDARGDCGGAGAQRSPGDSGVPDGGDDGGAARLGASDGGVARAGRLSCSVLAREDIDAILARGDRTTRAEEQRSGKLSVDAEGHGTHVASLAAGNGGPEKTYAGIAPEASVIIARVANGDGEIDEGAVIAATQLVFFLAERAGKPAVVNLSLGNDFGPHDGSSSLERALADQVGPEHPGRAIVVAAGNSAGLFRGVSGSFPEPFGVHTDISVPERASALVPLVTSTPSSMTQATLSGTIFVWISFRPGDAVSVGLDRRSGEWVPSQRPGAATEVDRSTKLSAIVVNGPLSELGLGFTDSNAAAVIIKGTWPRSETFAIRLEGRGTASLWVGAAGEIGPDGALFPAATKESTVTIPAAHPALIAVGATLNRSDWTDRRGQHVSVDTFGGVRNPPLDSLAFFSSAGPTTDQRMKPDLVAPGALVVGAMSRDADPASNPSSIFAGGSFCPPDGDDGDVNCAVIDDEHAVTIGTSMASPIVAGAVALLFEQRPMLTASEVLMLLQAGARRPEGLVPHPAQLGAGALDLPGMLAVEQAEATPVAREPSAGQSWLTLGATYAHPDPSWSIPAILKLRDTAGRVADGLDLRKLVVEVGGGTVVHDIERAAPGLFRLAVAADRGTGGDRLSVEIRYRGRLLASESVPIAVDVSVAREGFSARGGCAVASARSDPRLRLAALSLAITAWRGRRSIRAARTARNRDRTGSSARARRGSSRR